jgi:hypothetical protein
VAADDLTKQLSESFTPDDAFMFGPQSILEFDQSQAVSHSKESLSFDGVCSFHHCFQPLSLHEAHYILTNCLFLKREKDDEWGGLV